MTQAIPLCAALTLSLYDNEWPSRKERKENTSRHARIHVLAHLWAGLEDPHLVRGLGQPYLDGKHLVVDGRARRLDQLDVVAAFVDLLEGPLQDAKYELSDQLYT